MAEQLTRRDVGIYETATKGRYRIVISGGLDPLTGKYPPIWTTFHGNLTTARDYRNAEIAKVKAGKNKATSATVNDLFDAWLADLPRLKRAPRTIRAYRTDADTYWRKPIGRKRLGKVKRSDIRAVLDGLTDQGLAAPTVRRVHACASAAFSWGVYADWLPASEDPTNKIRLPELTDHAPNVPTPDVVRLVIDEALTSRMPEMARFVFLGAVLGCRSSELRALRISRIDLDAGFVGIEAAMSDEQDWTTKNRRVRMPAIDAATVAVVREQIEFLQDRLGPGHQLASDAFLFSDDLQGREHWKAEKVTRSVSCFFDHAGRDPHVEGEGHDVLEPCPAPGPYGGFTFKHLRRFATTYGRRLGFSAEAVAGRHGHDREVADKAYTGSEEAATDRALSAGLAGLIVRPDASA